MCFGQFSDWHKNKVNATLHILAFIVLVYGLWFNDLLFVGAAVIFAILGHTIQSLEDNSIVPKAKKRRR